MLKSFFGRVSKKLFGDRIWKELSRIGEEVFVYALGEAIYDKLSAKFKNMGKSEFIEFLRRDGFENPEKISKIFEKGKEIELKRELGKKKYEKISDELRKVKSLDEFKEILENEGVNPEEFLFKCSKNLPEDAKKSWQRSTSPTFYT